MPYVEIYEKGQSIASVGISRKTFKTGSEGFFGTGKVELDGKKYRVNILFILSKEKEEKVQ